MQPLGIATPKSNVEVEGGKDIVPTFTEHSGVDKI